MPRWTLQGHRRRVVQQQRPGAAAISLLGTFFKPSGLVWVAMRATREPSSGSTFFGKHTSRQSLCDLAGRRPGAMDHQLEEGPHGPGPR